ncbi:hypothetical protein [Undibacterium sp.]|uniref:hypothetical protein n=1 Tax=Undibacterium sp. TaxID=1914977 RepID=UPI00273088B4|nr:hypothetical protein [Undibacterium sp.]MDP1978682.1 hypothetical protein [Undibacterium sp.]
MEQKAIGPKEHVEGWLSRVGELSHWGGIVGILANWFPQESQQLCSKICHDLFSYAATIITEARRDRDIAVDLISSVTGLTFPDLPTNENKPNEVK